MKEFEYFGNFSEIRTRNFMDNHVRVADFLRLFYRRNRFSYVSIAIVTVMLIFLSHSAADWSSTWRNESDKDGAWKFVSRRNSMSALVTLDFNCSVAQCNV
jgi:hypothetical protein